MRIVVLNVVDLLLCVLIRLIDWSSLLPIFAPDFGPCDRPNLLEAHPLVVSGFWFWSARYADCPITLRMFFAPG